MKTKTIQADWVEPFLYYLLFDLAVVGITAIVYLGIRLMLKVLNKNIKNQSQYR